MHFTYQSLISGLGLSSWSVLAPKCEKWALRTKNACREHSQDPFGSKNHNQNWEGGDWCTISISPFSFRHFLSPLCLLVILFGPHLYLKLLVTSSQDITMLIGSATEHSFGLKIIKKMDPVQCDGGKTVKTSQLYILTFLGSRKGYKIRKAHFLPNFWLAST